MLFWWWPSKKNLQRAGSSMCGFSQMEHVLEHVSHWLDSSYEQLHENCLGVKAMTEDTEEASGPALPHSHIPLKGRYDTSYSLSGRIMWHSSYWTVHMNAGMVYWLNADNLDLLSHNINYATSSIPGVNKYFLLLFIYILINYVGRLRC